ncbi:MAG: DUF1287 domain-containing protein [Lachnospiraceae bacterium]|nr:DUF1287 domain-containing protein [Lachnospiraceae bacterium]
MKFRWKKILAALLPILVLLVAAAVFCFRPQHTRSDRLKDKCSTQYQIFHSSVDRDQDGIDDESDMLQGALEYINTRPKYKSQYYSGGYPNDGYGVCTDVAANACLAAGYDLMALVSADIAEDPKAYGIDEPDPNIDFRRVKNLRVYFKRHAVELTTDLTDCEAWQGGDIVIFTSHIGIVSDRRNAHGVPYVIHHSSPRQFRYEQDILEKRDDLVGHYRISE